MEKSILFILSIPLSLFLWFGEHNNTPGNKSFSMTDTIPPKKDSTYTLTCNYCHGDLAEKKLKHTTNTNKGCEDCHATSGIPMDHKKGTIVLQKPLPDLCLSCHDKTKSLISSSRVVHQVVNDKKSCVNCHSPHSSDEKSLLVTNRKDLCLSCHNKTITTKTKTLANIGQLDKNSKVVHPPFKKCSSSCHNPHASSNDKLLNTFFTSETYIAVNPDSFALCWECHDPELITNPKTTTATNFRNGDKNLHYVHVHGEKGRSCMLCHNPHASNNPYLVREKVGFGNNWSFRMNYSSNENGGSCAPGCHVERKYTR